VLSSPAQESKIHFIIIIHIYKMNQAVKNMEELFFSHYTVLYNIFFVD